MPPIIKCIYRYSLRRLSFITQLDTDNVTRTVKSTTLLLSNPGMVCCYPMKATRAGGLAPKLSAIIISVSMLVSGARVVGLTDGICETLLIISGNVYHVFSLLDLTPYFYLSPTRCVDKTRELKQ